LHSIKPFSKNDCDILPVKAEKRPLVYDADIIQATPLSA
jgi:hypothetical protein